MLATGTYFGLVGHAWYTFLDRKFPGPTRKVVSKKLICEGIVGEIHYSIIIHNTFVQLKQISTFIPINNSIFDIIS